MSHRAVSHRRGTRAFESPAFTSNPTVGLLRGLTDTELNELVRLSRLELARRRARLAAAVIDLDVERAKRERGGR